MDKRKLPRKKIPCECVGCGIPLIRRPSHCYRAKCDGCKKVVTQAYAKKIWAPGADTPYQKRKRNHPEKLTQYRIRYREKRKRLRNLDNLLGIIANKGVETPRNYKRREKVTCNCIGCSAPLLRHQHYASKALCTMCKRKNANHSMQKRRENVEIRKIERAKAKKYHREQKKRDQEQKTLAGWNSGKGKKSLLTNWQLQSPSNEVYIFDDLKKFIAENLQLFPGRSPEESDMTRARLALQTFYKLRNGKTAVWRGWRWVGSSTYHHPISKATKKILKLMAAAGSLINQSKPTKTKKTA